jgi:hypothetical protein
LVTEMTAMMRKNKTSRRVHTFWSDSIRSEEIAAADMAPSRDGSREGISDMRTIHQLQYASISSSHDLSAWQNQLES